LAQPVTHFEVMGTDGEKLREFYAELFDWTIDADNPQEIRTGRARDQRHVGGGDAWLSHHT
jgi:uncharacterized protein